MDRPQNTMACPTCKKAGHKRQRPSPPARGRQAQRRLPAWHRRSFFVVCGSSPPRRGQAQKTIACLTCFPGSSQSCRPSDKIPRARNPHATAYATENGSSIGIRRARAAAPSRRRCRDRALPRQYRNGNSPRYLRPLHRTPRRRDLRRRLGRRKVEDPQRQRRPQGLHRHDARRAGSRASLARWLHCRQLRLARRHRSPREASRARRLLGPAGLECASGGA